jgi:prepilin-type N-terminal cleavage/methylation domain-containing protein
MHSARGIRRGFTLLEIIVSILLFTVGALGYAALTTRMASAFLLNSRRARAGELVNSRREILLRDGCARAVSGSENRFGITVRWYAEPPAEGRMTTRIVATRSGAVQEQTDSLVSYISCM